MWGGRFDIHGLVNDVERRLSIDRHFLEKPWILCGNDTEYI